MSILSLSAGLLGWGSRKALRPFAQPIVRSAASLSVLADTVLCARNIAV